MEETHDPTVIDLREAIASRFRLRVHRLLSVILADFDERERMTARVVDWLMSEEPKR